MHRRFMTPRPTRRGLLTGTLALGAGLAAPRWVFAQVATPATPTEAITTQTRKEFRAEIEKAQGYSEAATPGGSFIDSNVTDIKTIHPLLADDADSLGVVGMIYDGL